MILMNTGVVRNVVTFTYIFLSSCVATNKKFSINNLLAAHHSGEVMKKGA